MSGRTIRLTDVDPRTARWCLKGELDKFGKIDAMHMGDRSTTAQRFLSPWARFETHDGAQRALDALNRGTVIMCGIRVKGHWDEDAARTRSPPRHYGGGARQADATTSRDLFLEALAPRARRSRSTSSYSASASASGSGRHRHKRRRRRAHTRQRNDNRSRSRQQSRPASRHRAQKRQRRGGGIGSRSQSRSRGRGQERRGAGLQTRKKENSARGSRCPLGHGLVPADARTAPCGVCGDTEMLMRCPDCAYNLCEACVSSKLLT